jgi:hypothetical protein
MSDYPKRARAVSKAVADVLISFTAAVHALSLAMQKRADYYQAETEAATQNRDHTAPAGTAAIALAEVSSRGGGSIYGSSEKAVKPSGNTDLQNRSDPPVAVRPVSTAAPAGSSAPVHAWWRQPSVSTMEQCLTELASTAPCCIATRPVFTEHVPDSANGNVLVPGHAPYDAASTKRRASFYASEEWVFKVYRIGVLGRALTEKVDIVFAASACVDAGATEYVGKHCNYQCMSTGLVHAGTAYICIMRRRLTAERYGPEQTATLFTWKARVSGVGHNDVHTGNMGRNPTTGLLELFDFERATRYAPDRFPPVEFLTRYAAAAQETNMDNKQRLLRQIEPCGLYAVYRFYMNIWKDGVRGFSMAFDSAVFESAPVGEWRDST